MATKRNRRNRQEKILSILNEKRDVRTDKLSALLQTSEVTIRNDLRSLEKEGKLIRRQGGALYSEIRPLKQRDSKHHLAQRQQIAQAALSFIKEGDHIILDSGRTVAELAKKLHNLKNLTILTKGLDSAVELLHSPKKEIYIIGGRIQEKYSIEGSDDLSYLDSFAFDSLFLGTIGMDISIGTTTNSLAGARVNKKFIHIARKVIVLCPSYKINKSSVFRVLSCDRMDVFITDEEAPWDFVESLKKKNVNVIVAKAETAKKEPES